MDPPSSDGFEDRLEQLDSGLGSSIRLPSSPTTFTWANTIGDRGPSPPPTSAEKAIMTPEPRRPKPLSPLKELSESPSQRIWRRASRAAIKVSSEAQQLWKEGNDLHEKGYYSRATVFFTRSINMQPLPEYLSSRSMAWLKLGNNVAALKDAMQAVEKHSKTIDRYLKEKSRDRRRQYAGFIECYYRRGLCFAAQGGSLGSTLAIQDFRIVTTQCVKLQYWPGEDPPGWEERRLEAEEEYDEEQKYKAAQREEQNSEDEEEEEEEDRYEDVLQRARLGMILAHINEVKSNCSEAISNPESDILKDDIDHLSLYVNHTTTTILLPSGTLTESHLNKVLDKISIGGTLHVSDVIGLIARGRKLFLELPNIVDIPKPTGEGKIHVVGDIHGQLHDLLHILSLLGTPSKENIIIFNGDFVDRGSYGLECVTVLLLYKITYPEFFFMVRGNHEDHTVNEQYHFLPEVLIKYGCVELYHRVQALFKSMPLGHLIGNSILVVHGGLPKSGATCLLEDIQKIDRDIDVPESGILTDLLWSDPAPEEGTQPSSRKRGVLYGPDITKSFLKNNNLSLIVRSHDINNCTDTGYCLDHDGTCITVFSAPNYCGLYGNKGAIVHIGSDMEPTFTTFDSAEVPLAFVPCLTPHNFHFNFANVASAQGIR